jgi:hypothetical protein
MCLPEDSWDVPARGRAFVEVPDLTVLQSLLCRSLGLQREGDPGAEVSRLRRVPGYCG